MTTATGTPRWNVRTEGGDLVTTLEGLAEVLGTDTDRAAENFQGTDYYKAAPSVLRAEIDRVMERKAKPKPGGGTPPPITSGSFVQWGSNRGRVDLVVTNGKVPGVEQDVTGSKDSPAVRVVVWAKKGDSYAPTGKKVGAMAHTLKRIAPLNRASGKSAEPGDAQPDVELVTLLAEHEARDLPEQARVTGTAVKTAYERGLEAWPGADRVTLSRQQWGVERVKALLAVAAGDDPVGVPHDLALLHKAHPRHPSHVRPSGWVEIDPTEVAAFADELAG